MRQHIFVLELATPENAFLIGATREHYGSAAFKSIQERISDLGGSVRQAGIADGALINRINREESEESSGSEDVKPIMRDIEKLVFDAMEERVSDIHIETRGSGAMVRFRINGRLRKHSDSWTADYVMTLARALHTMADEESKSPTFNTDAQLSVTRELPNGAKVKLRAQLSPAYPDGAIDIVIRVLMVDAKAQVRSLADLGYSSDHIAMLEYMRASPHGLIVIAGETGSGKTTTLQTIMHMIRSTDHGLKLISIEDPPEYVLEGVTQIPVARRRDKPDENPFVAPMRNTMRMDPDVIMLGEIRDSITADLMTGMVTSGHKALTTIHTESALGIIGRLRNMGVDPDVLGARGFLSGLVFQTLVPTLCPHCKVEFESRPDLVAGPLGDRVRHVAKPGDTLFVESETGCKHCKFTGIVGRTVCAEMVVPDNVIREAIMAGDMRKAREHWRGLRDLDDQDSMLGATALDHAIQKMRRGDVSPISVESSLGLLHDFTRSDINTRTGASLGLAG
ncbi:GspE/PulE family protein [Paucibacter soli]|uniref:GspE/PulE family protein n=1 Tax=Paucibacter soli TaxID=3133433 RepID=UPI0030A56346